jgi:hypothetical protein
LAAAEASFAQGGSNLLFEVAPASSVSGGAITLRWPSETNVYTSVVFTVGAATNLGSGFSDVSGPIAATPPENVYTSAAGTEAVYYRVSSPGSYTAIDDVRAWDAYDAGTTDTLSAKGYVGGVFDGRYIYFAPSQDGAAEHGRFLRHDTEGAFTNAASWDAYDAGNTDGLSTKRYQGGAFDGRYVYFVPNSFTSAPALRYDAQGEFTNAASWDAFDAGNIGGLNTKGYQGCAFDGRHVYYAAHANTNFHGVFLRYATTGAFASASSWEAYDAGTTDGLNTRGYSGGIFDGRFVYFVPSSDGLAAHGRVLRFDTEGTFTNSASWNAYNAAQVNTNAIGFKGGVFDGRYAYFVQFAFSPTGGTMTRYDTQGVFTNAASWLVYNASTTGAYNAKGYHAGAFDGRYVWFVPDNNGARHGVALRYDTFGGFSDGGSWQAYDAGATDGYNTKGYEGAVFDGRYLYFVPFKTGAPSHGVVLRFDAKLPRQVPGTVTGGSFF